MIYDILILLVFSIIIGIITKVVIEFILLLVELLRVFFIFILDEEDKIQKEKTKG